MNYQEAILSELGFVPTNDQTVVVKAIDEFLIQPNSLELLLLKGYAGTGKSSLIGALVKALSKTKKKTFLMAPTGRAAKVMSGYAGKPALTIHKKIYFIDEFSGELDYSLGKNMHKNTIFIVDEASMISGVGYSRDYIEQKDILEDMLRYVYNGENNKLVVVGDTAQLPPVGMELSPALDAKYIEETYGLHVIDLEMTEVVRQEKESGILKNATDLRERIAKNDFSLLLDDNFEDVEFITGLELQDKLDEAIGRGGVEETLVVCRSNKRANLFNQQVRHRILWMEDELSAGDLLMVVKNNYHWLDAKSKQGFIANGDIIEVRKVVRYEELYGTRFADIEAVFVDSPDEQVIECKVMLEAISVESASMPREFLKKLFYEIELDFQDIASKRKRYSLIMKTPHFNALQVKFSYSVTCHKAQGGQWENVFIDQGFLTEEMINMELLRWMYTAITRSKSKLYFVNFSDSFKYST